MRKYLKKLRLRVIEDNNDIKIKEIKNLSFFANINEIIFFKEK
jgi:hypothetical protein